MHYERLFGNPVCYENEATLPNQQKALLHLMHPTDPSCLFILIFSQPCQRSFNFCFHFSFGLLSFSSFNFLSTFSTFTINTTMNNNDPHSQSAPRSPHDILVHGRSEDSQDSMNISPLNSIDNMDNVSLIATNSPHTVIAPQLTFLRSPQSGRAQPELDLSPDSQHFAPRAPSTLIPVDEGVNAKRTRPLLSHLRLRALLLNVPTITTMPLSPTMRMLPLLNHRRSPLWNWHRWRLKKSGTHGLRSVEQHTKPHTKRTCAIRERRPFGSTTSFA